MKKPPYNEVVRGILKNGKIIYFQRKLDIINNFKHNDISKFHQKKVDSYLLDPPPANEYDFTMRDLKSWRLLSSPEDFSEYHKYIDNYYKEHQFTSGSFEGEITKKFIKWENDHIAWLRNWIEFYGYSDGEIENPEYVMQTIWEMAYEEGVKDGRKN